MSLRRGQGRSQDFSKGRWNYGSKSYEKEKLLVIRIARKAHILWINSWLYSPRNLGSLQLNCHLVSLIFFHDDRKTQPPWLHVSAEFCFDLWFFSTVGKHISQETHQTSLRKTGGIDVFDETRNMKFNRRFFKSFHWVMLAFWQIDMCNDWKYQLSAAPSACDFQKVYLRSLCCCNKCQVFSTIRHNV